MKMLLLSLVAFAPTGLLNPLPGAARVYVRVDVDAQGAIESVRFRDGTGERLQAVLRERVQSWRFDPALVDGRPAPAQTTITIDLRAGADGQSIDIASVSAGPAPIFIEPPRYAPNGRAALQGNVVLRCRIAADGRCRDITVEDATAPAKLQKSAKFALANWRFETEVVSGVAVTPWVLIPFCFSQRPADQPVPECKVGQQRAIAGSEPPRLKLHDPLAQR
ncbi:TonB family protein [Tahibacter sp.]|uniref:TonB family protein n=1 Tax=Tahibacter sp. TaxID=2056211 RepID=UPI0028C4A74E|nr:TonB family protein [Tahibacter sp.]